MSRIRLTDWVIAGAADAASHTIYERGPGPKPPEVAHDALPPEWHAYFDGHFSYIQDRLRGLHPRR